MLDLFVKSFPLLNAALQRKRRKHGNNKEVAAQTPLEDPGLETFSYHQTGGIQMRNTEISAGKFFCLILVSMLPEMPRDAGVRNRANEK